MNREVLRYTFISMGAITFGLLVYYIYTIYKDKK